MLRLNVKSIYKIQVTSKNSQYIKKVYKIIIFIHIIKISLLEIFICKFFNLNNENLC